MAQVAAQRWSAFLDATLTPAFVDATCRAGLAADLAERFRAAYAPIGELDSAKAEFMLDRLAACLGAADGSRHPVFNLDALHSWLSYRSERRLYDDLLQRGVARSESKSEYAVACVGYWAETLRRRNRLAEAEALFRRIAPLLENGQSWRALSRILYGLAYIPFLRGDYDDAARTFADSARRGDDAGDEVGAAISRCLEGRSVFLGAADAAGRVRFQQILDAAGEVFIRRAREPDADPRAVRWVMNYHAHCFEVAFDAGNVDEAATRLRALETDPWVQTFRGTFDLLTYRARLLMLQNRWDNAIAQFRQSQQVEAAAWSADAEAAARQWYDLMRSLLRGGRATEALAVKDSGLACPDDLGNRVWKQRLRAEAAT